MSHKTKLLIIALIFSVIVISHVYAQSLEFSDVKEKIIQTGKYEIRITGDEFDWVEDVQIEKGELKIIAKEEKDRKKVMPDKISVYSKEKTKEKELTKSKDNGKDIFLMEWNDEKYKKIGENSIEIIEIVDADHLDSKRNFIEDVYNEVYKLDNITKTIPSGDYVRIKFEQNLTNKKDITIYARGSESSYIQVYEKGSTHLLGTFDEINDTLLDYRIILTELGDTEQDTFDLKILGGSIEFDYITDPTYENYTTGQAVYGVFADGLNTNFLNLTAQFRTCSLGDCSGTTWNTYINNTFSSLSSEQNSTYFQFRSLFATQNQNYTPYLFNFTIGYTILDNEGPTINITHPLDDNVYPYSINEINYTVFDSNPSECWYSNNSGLWNSTHLVAGTNFTNVITNEGWNNFRVYCNDLSGNENYTNVNFYISISREQGGGTNIGRDFILPYNEDIVCKMIGDFRELYSINNTINYSVDEFEDYRNRIISKIGIGFSKDTMNSYLKDYDKKCNINKKICEYSYYFILDHLTTNNILNYGEDDFEVLVRQLYDSEKIRVLNYSFLREILIDYNAQCLNETPDLIIPEIIIGNIPSSIEEDSICKSNINYTFAGFYDMDWSIPFFKINLGGTSCSSIKLLRWAFLLEKSDKNTYLLGIKLWWILSILILWTLSFLYKMYKKNMKINKLIDKF